MHRALAVLLLAARGRCKLAVATSEAVHVGNCSLLGDCASCAAGRDAAGAYGCLWCEIDGLCHDAGSAASPCSPQGSGFACVSNSDASGCARRGPAACSAGSPNRATQVHLSVAGRDGMRVAWKTEGPVSRAEVVFSTDMTREHGIAVPAERSGQYLSGHGFHHVAKLQGLKPGTTYQYRIVCDGNTTTFNTFSTLDVGQDASFLVVGDMGFGENGQAVASRKRIEALKASVDAVLHVGDIAYADDSFLHCGCMIRFCYEEVYDGWMEWLENVTDSKPYMVAVGNHESECHSPACQFLPSTRRNLSNFSAYNVRWAMPSAESGGTANMWYSFDYGPVHFVVVNTETDFPDAGEENHGDGGEVLGMPAGHFAPDGAYLKWLEADLAAASVREDRPWIVAMGHRPWLTHNALPTEGAVQRAHAALFQNYSVDLYLAGHIHSYHRFLPKAGNAATPMIVTGGAGCDEYASDKLEMGDFNVTGNNSLWDFRYYNLQTQVGVLKASSSELSWTAVLSSKGDVLDTVTIHRNATELVTYV